MKNAHSLEPQHIGVVSESVISSEMPPKIQERKRKAGFALAAVLSSIGFMPGCAGVSNESQPEQFFQHPRNPNTSWLGGGGNTPRLFHTTPDRFAPLMEILQKNKLNREDWIPFLEFYTRAEVMDQHSRIEIDLYEQLDKIIRNSDSAHPQMTDLALRKFCKLFVTFTLTRKLDSLGELSWQEIVELGRAFDVPSSIKPIQDLEESLETSGEDTQEEN